MSDTQQPTAIKHYSSRFIVDVNITNDYISLIDPSHTRHIIELTNEKGIQSFKAWMQNVFLKGVAGTLTVFSWHKKEVDGEARTIIDQIFTTSKQSQPMS